MNTEETSKNTTGGACLVVAVSTNCGFGISLKGEQVVKTINLTEWIKINNERDL